MGPTARGELDPRALSTLQDIGAWMRPHARSIDGAAESADAAPPDCRLTQRGDRLYLHLFAWPPRHVSLEGLAGRVAYAQFLHDGSEVRLLDGLRTNDYTVPTGLDDRTLTLELPAHRPDVLVPVVELFLRE